MEIVEWYGQVDDDDEYSCLAREDCIEELLSDAPTDCLYCRLGELGDED